VAYSCFERNFAKKCKLIEKVGKFFVCFQAIKAKYVFQKKYKINCHNAREAGVGINVPGGKCFFSRFLNIENNICKSSISV
jgi:hypothetical protein